MHKHLSLFACAIMLLTAVCAGAVETKDIKFSFKNADPVVFSHAYHLDKYNNNCKICHDAIFNIRNRKHFTMAEMEKTKSCGACHSGMKAFSVASEKECVKCHKGKPRDVTYKIKGLGEATFSHSTHIAKTGGACKSCHNGKVITGKEKAVTMAEMEKGKTCGACHNGKSVFSVTANCQYTIGGRVQGHIQSAGLIFYAQKTLLQRLGHGLEILDLARHGVGRSRRSVERDQIIAAAAIHGNNACRNRSWWLVTNQTAIPM